MFSTAPWALIQLALLLLGASGAQLWSHPPQPPESLTYSELLCGQFVLFAMLYPVLARTPWALLINILLTLPFAELAGGLANTTAQQLVVSETCLAIWMFGLGLIGIVASDPQSIHPTVSAIVVLFSAGGAVLDYLRWETHLAAAVDTPFHPISMLPNLVLQNWPTALLQSAFPLVMSGMFYIRWKIRYHPPLPPTPTNFPNF